MHFRQQDLSRSVRAVILQYLLNRRGLWPVSVRQAIAEVRSQCPDCILSDRILADAIAEDAIEVGLDINFDRGARFVEHSAEAKTL